MNTSHPTTNDLLRGSNSVYLADWPVATVVKEGYVARSKKGLLEAVWGPNGLFLLGCRRKLFIPVRS
jgi:hypothetical protein